LHSAGIEQRINNTCGFVQEENTETLYDEIAQVEMNHARQALTHAESQIRIEKCFSS
jgi:hypothetical protein